MSWCFLLTEYPPQTKNHPDKHQPPDIRDDTDT